MKTQYLTTSQKERLLPFLLQRDGVNCWYCKKPFEPLDNKLKRTFDHLDNNRTNNDVDNLVLAHWQCNQMKKYHVEYKVMAADKRNENLDSLNECVPISAKGKEASKEIDINVAQKKLTYEYLHEKLVGNKVRPPAESKLEFRDTASSIAYIFWERTGHGSSETVRRYINEFCSSAGPFVLVEENGGLFIKRRVGN